MTWDILLKILVAISPLVSATIVALLENWDKINPSKRMSKEIYITVQKLEKNDAVIQKQYDELSETVSTIASAQRTSLQTHILEDCKHVQDSIDDCDIDYEESLKQLIILYREYWLCDYNSQGRIYFNDTIKKASEHSSTLVHELMNLYFPEYDPDIH